MGTCTGSGIPASELGLVSIQPDYENLWTYNDKHFLECSGGFEHLNQYIPNNALTSTQYKILSEDRPYVNPDDDEAGHTNWDDNVNPWTSY